MSKTRKKENYLTSMPLSQADTLHCNIENI